MKEIKIRYKTPEEIKLESKFYPRPCNTSYIEVSIDGQVIKDLRRFAIDINTANRYDQLYTLEKYMYPDY